MFQKYN